MGFIGTTTISYRHSWQMYASQPVQAKQLLHERSSCVLSHDFLQWEQVIVIGFSIMGVTVNWY
ncbi:MAG: hypothetical protein Q8K69_06550 [Bacteroidota bacterium]|nr:hypothetical protein [Bacteroidota bacterium]